MDGSFSTDNLINYPSGQFQITSTPTTDNAPLFSKEVSHVAFFQAATKGDRKGIKKILKKGLVSIDSPNGIGQTALYLACNNGHLGVVEVLLAHGANPNERCNDEGTAMHAASYNCNVEIMLKLIEAGGDLRLHDKLNRSVPDWALFNPDEKKSRKMVLFLKKAQEVAIHTTNKGTLTGVTATLRPDSVKNTLFRKKPEVTPIVLSNLLPTGFGKVCGDGHHMGLLGLIPLVEENRLRHDDYGVTYNNGPFMVMESMQWNNTAVTVKRLHKNPPQGGKVDLLINECETISRLRHPQLLLLMGVCQTNCMASLVLLYERVGCGSLFSYLYQKNETLEMVSICDVVRQVCEAVIFLHHQRYLHTSISSHAVQLVSPSQAKLSNFEYMVMVPADGSPSPGTGAVNNTWLNAVYNWMAPEVMAGEPPQYKSDLYSITCLLWELLEIMPPMSGMEADAIRDRLLTKQNRLFSHHRSFEPYTSIINYGLALKPQERLLTLEWIRDALSKVIVENESVLIMSGEMHHRQSRCIPHYLPHHEMIITTTDDESEGTIVNESQTSIFSEPARSRRAGGEYAGNMNFNIHSNISSSTVLEDISEVDHRMVSPPNEPQKVALGSGSSSGSSTVKPSASSVTNKSSSSTLKQSPSNLTDVSSFTKVTSVSNLENTTMKKTSTSTITNTSNTRPVVITSTRDASVSTDPASAFTQTAIVPPRSDISTLGSLSSSSSGTKLTSVSQVTSSGDTSATTKATTVSQSTSTALTSPRPYSSDITRLNSFRFIHRTQSSKTLPPPPPSIVLTKQKSTTLPMAPRNEKSGVIKIEKIELPPPSDSVDNRSHSSNDSFHTVVEVPVCPTVAPPREEHFKLPSGMEPPPSKDQSEVPHEGRSLAATSSKPVVQDVSTKPKTSTRKKFFRSMRRRSSASSTSDESSAENSKSKALSSKPSKLSMLRSVMGGKKRSNTPDISVDISGIHKLDSDTGSSTVREPTPPPLPSQPPPLPVNPPPAFPTNTRTSTPNTTPSKLGKVGLKGSEVQSSGSGSSPSNPFKKYSKMEVSCDDIISEEVKAILARPRKILKLPSFYERRPLPHTVTGTLLRQHSVNVAFPHPSPPPEPSVRTSLQRRTTIGPSSQSSWTEMPLTANLSLPVACEPHQHQRSGRSSVSFTESCPKLTNSHHDYQLDQLDESDMTLSFHSGSNENACYKPASHSVPSPLNYPTHHTHEAVNYHLPSPSPSPSPHMQRRMMEEGRTPSPIAPVRSTKSVALQRSSTILPTYASSTNIKDEWLQAYAGSTVPPGVTKDPVITYRAAQRATTRFHTMLHEASSEQCTASTTNRTTNNSYRDAYGRSSSYHRSPTRTIQRSGAMGTVDSSSKGPIKNIIASFQGKLEEHIQKQAILQLKHRPEGTPRGKDTFSSNTFHTPKGKAVVVPQCSDEQLQLSLEGGPGMQKRIPPVVVSTISTASINLTKPRTQVPSSSPRTIHRRRFSETLVQIEAVKKDRDNHSSSVSNTPRSTSSQEQHDRDDDDDDTDSIGSDLSDYIEHVLSSSHQYVLEKYKHPDCPHSSSYLGTSTLVGSVSDDDDHDDDDHDYEGALGKLYRSPAYTNRAAMKREKANRSCTESASCRCISETGLSNRDKKRSSDTSSRSEGTGRRSIEEFYFDDELDPASKARNLRLVSPSYATSNEAEIDSFLLHGDSGESGGKLHVTSSVDDYEGTPYKTMDVTDYERFKQERKMTSFSGEDDCNNSDDLIVKV